MHMGDIDYSTSQKLITDPDNRGAASASRLKPQTLKAGAIWRGATKRRRHLYLMGRTINGKQKQRAANNPIKLESISHDNICEFERKGLGHKYQPRLFQEIVGHKLVVKTLSNAIDKKKIAPLYLFHGPNGVGKTSTARVFAMALNCDSSLHNKPCCSCKGCSRSLYTMELCSGNRIAGFEKIKTLLQNTSFARAIPGLKVLIIEECHLLTSEAWDEVMSLVEGEYGSTLVFLLITTDANSIITNISSRCQKFFFPKLKDEDVAGKLSRILVHESMTIEKEALELIVAKSQGSLRDAENILDQLALLGPTISTSVVQQLVGLIPQNKLLDFLAVAVSGDNTNTIRYAKKLSEWVEPASFVSQLATLITNVLSGSAAMESSSSAHKKLLTSTSGLSKTHSARLCYILKALVKTERQLRSSTDQTSKIIAAFLDITSVKASSRMPADIVLPRSPYSSSFSEITLRTLGEPHTSFESIDENQRCQRKEKSSRPSLSDMEKLWKDVLKRVESSHTKRFLRDQVKLALLSISRTNAIVHLTFKRPEDKMAAEISEESLVKALEVAIGCPVTLHMSLEALTLGQDGKTTILSGTNPLYSQPADVPQSDRSRNGESAIPEGLRLSKSKSCSTSQRPHRYSSKGRDLNTVENPSSEYHLTTKDAQRTNLMQAGDSKNATQTMRANRPRHRWLSLSSIPQSDASVEPYSQDVIYENSNKDGDDTMRKIPKFQKGFSKTSKDRGFREPADQLQSNPAWGSVDICC